MTPVVSIVGRSKSGKTTFIEKLIVELKSRGYRVATIKHIHRQMSFDKPDKDSWRHIQSGSEAAGISSPNEFVLIKPVTGENMLEQYTRYFDDDYDIILTEGFKEGNAPKIEIHRQEVSPPLASVKKLIAIVTNEFLETKTRQFSFEDVKGVADLLEKGFIAPQKKRLSLYVNNKPVSLSAFPREFIASTILGIAASLKGVGNINSIKISLKK